MSDDWKSRAEEAGAEVSYLRLRLELEQAKNVLAGRELRRLRDQYARALKRIDGFGQAETSKRSRGDE